MANKNNNVKSRKHGRPMASVEYTDLESHTLFPHIPISSPDLRESDLEKHTKKDLNSILLLLFLYILQGIPLGLSGSLPMLLQSRKVSYSDQALFSLVYWPFSIKLLWAPLVDSIYLKWFGRRKTWLIPIQYLMGLFMLILSTQAKYLLGDGDESSHVNIAGLTIIFISLNFLAATQDIAVDGWALTMLSKSNVGWASTCNSVGQTAGYFLGNVLFLALESADFCNRYLRSQAQNEGIITLSGFLWFWGVTFFITTTIVGVCKKEHMDLEADPEQGIVETYKILLKVICLPPVITYTIILLISKVTFAASDALTGLKLIEAGMPKERLALFAIPMVPIQIALPLLISKYTSGPKPMDIWLKAYPYRMAIGLMFCGVVYWAGTTQTIPGEFPWYFYVVALTLYALHQVAVYCMFVSQMAFHAKISDPLIGGTYMTLLNTVANLGGNWPSTLTLWLVDHVTWKNCSDGSSCDSKETEKACAAAGSVCSTTYEGYYILSVICCIFGFVFLKSWSRRLKQIGNYGEQSWRCSMSSTSST
ncbi:acetyl-coenzyme A transporter 1-like [Physella acuta]|uniref:acetyl-coenzyme A transporter 1-like n=1 Tax=Physella acuta TaxID=109671 RepID=UPI0027DB1ECF|nr:acetyl-coenzyme A transporter 1-like [Physella acuta]XP_059142089.1 acetyl-coenzyme A transporter 1-like [Physella acuta]XP_059142090.1 acetyl-coenzyme A transporter 1-like [Physella acuta]XP_059142091.1 acetyl-coenzyme A transporter 1-like [Physella acuta]XP_059142092.1 acetyl-coenzyme A transporter 1-like [Physella acuta]XP_059142093.1 acetyl-coenzyme A transporter 1-like [Physella acuta]